MINIIKNIFIYAVNIVLISIAINSFMGNPLEYEMFDNDKLTNMICTGMFGIFNICRFMGSKN